MSSVPHGFDLANAQIITRQCMRVMGPTMLVRETGTMAALGDVSKRLMEQFQAVRFEFRSGWAVCANLATSYRFLGNRLGPPFWAPAGNPGST
jgi:hypothetical protein